MIELKSGMRCLLLQDRKEARRMVLLPRWYAIMIYYFPLKYLMGMRPQSSEYSLLMGLSMIWSSYVGVPSLLMVMLLYVLSYGVLCELIGSLVSIDQTPCWICVMWPLMVSAVSGKYLDALA